MRLKAGAPSRMQARLLKRYVIKNNKANLIFSLFLTAISTVTKELNPGSTLFEIASTLAIIRLISRSIEISYAFGRDVIQKNNNATKLRKEQRIKLALSSYLEIFIYSAGAYTALPGVGSASEAIILSLNVGTLTNVGYAYTTPGNSLAVNIIFCQVITTLSLAVLSLAAYLSRQK